MSLKFRLKGLAETFVDFIKCPGCGHDGGEEGDNGFTTELTKVTYDGIIVVVQCAICENIFLPDTQKNGVVNPGKLRMAVQKDSITTGQPILCKKDDVQLEVEKINASRNDKLQ
ncbi:MAG: hypothetical protein KBC84_08955 [Proteobacteria bacterium]|nr:hypothetical protein [Pseudomonadota bacterium]